MRPPQNAGGFGGIPAVIDGLTPGFNEAPAKRGGIRA